VAPAPAAAASVDWGINLDGPLTGNPPAFSYQRNPYFVELLGGSSCQRATAAICYGRIYVPWDAASNGKGSFAAGTCQAAPSGPGTPDAIFRAAVLAAARLFGIGHLLVSLTTAPAGSPDDIWPTDAEYECGLSALEHQAPGVVEWEVFNEPDSNYAAATNATDCTHRNGVWVGSGSAYQCLLGSRKATPSGGNGHGGSAQAAAYWYLDAKRVDSNPGHTLLAGGFNYSSSRCTPTTCYYLGGYMRVLSRIYSRPPDAIALNPYIDVSYAALNGGDPVPPPSSGLPSARGAIEAIDRTYPSDPPIWFTEVGVWLTDGGKEPVTSGCGDGNPRDDGSWAACLNGNPNAQALAAEGYLRLPDESSQVKRVYYYDFDGQNAGWDSGLVNLSPPLLGAHGYGVPRTAWCTLEDYAHGEAPAAAAADAVRAGSRCVQAQGGNAAAVDVAYLSDPLSSHVSPAVTPGELGRDVALTVAERIRALIAAL
jgi:hypothetical protein